MAPVIALAAACTPDAPLASRTDAETAARACGASLAGYDARQAHQGRIRLYLKPALPGIARDHARCVGAFLDRRGKRADVIAPGR